VERNELNARIVLALVVLVTTGPASEWVVRYNGPGNGNDGVRAAALSPTGYLYATGYAAGPDASSDFFTVRYDTATGNPTTALFQYLPGLGRADGAAALALDAAGNVFVTGFSTDTFRQSGTLRYPRQVTTLKYNSGLGLTWSASYRASNTSTNAGISGRAIAAKGGSAFVTGACYSNSDSLVAVTLGYEASSGSQRWAKTLEGDLDDGADTGRAVAVDAAGRVVVAAAVATDSTDYDLVAVAYDSTDGDELLTVHEDVAEADECPVALCVDAACNVYIAEVVDGPSLLLLSYDSTGARRWARSFDDYDCEARAMVLDKWGGLYVAGVSDGDRSNTALFLGKFMATTGAKVWDVRHESPDSAGEAGASAIALDRDGCVYATGYSTGVGTGKDFLTTKYSASGALLDTWTYDNGGYDEATAVCVDTARTVYFSGMSAGTNGTDVATVKREQVFVSDIGVSSISSPGSMAEYGDKVVPMATVFANESTAAQCSVEFRIGTDSIFYRSVKFVQLNPGSSASVTFDTWYVQQPGSHVACCSLHYDDDNPGNNQLSIVVSVPPGWKEMEPMRSEPSGKPVKDGGWLATDASTGLVYAAKGNKTDEFYAYGPDQNQWITDLSPIPDGNEAKKPSRGCRGACDGSNYVYMTKGNSTLGFWRYNISTDSWKQLRDVPSGTSGKKLKDGADLCYVQEGGQGYCYLLKGNKNEFYRYDVTSGSWQTLGSAPGTEKWKEGSFLVYDGSRYVYAHKAYYNRMWRYDTDGDSWAGELTGMPFIGQSGKKKKHGHGGGATWHDGSLLALKGRNTQEFWRYDPTANLWGEMETMPQYGSTLLKRKVKHGGDLTTDGAVLYALKGNKTLELWRYVPPQDSEQAFGYVAGRPGGSGMDGAETGLAEGMTAITPRWSGDGSAVVYVREAEDGVGAGYDQVYLVRASAPGTEVRVVDIAMDCSEPVFRPSGSHICFVLDDTVTDRLQIATVPVPDADFAREQQEKTEERAVTNDGAGTGTEQKESSVRLTRPVQLSVSGGRDRVVVPGLYAAGLPGAQAWGPQTPTLLTDDEWDHFSPSYSPSSGLICYCKDDATDRSQLYLISSGGGTEQALTDYSDADCESPSFLDNDHVTFIYSKDGEYDRVGKLNINSQQLTILTEGEYDAETPDPAKGGQSIAFGAQDNDGTYQVGLVRSDGTDERLVTSSSLDLEEPDWSGDGYSIAAVRWFGLTSQIGMVDTASGDFTRLTDSSCIRDKPDVYYSPFALTNFVVYEREDPNATDGIRPKPKRRPGTGIYLVRHKKKQDGVMGAGLATELRRALPNPASGPVTVYWQVAQAGTDATVKVYDASGRQVRVLFSGKAKPGLNEATWTCKDQKGRAVPNGVYFCTLETKDDRISRKLILAAGE